MGMAPATRIQICGAYQGSDSPAETTHTRHHRSTPGHTHFRPRKTSSAMLTESSPIRRPPPDIPPLDLTVSPSSPRSRISLRLFCASACGPSLAGASVIDGQDLATVNHSNSAP